MQNTQINLKNTGTEQLGGVIITKETTSKRQRCEVYSRVVGYLRPIAQWNNGKRAEFDDRKTFAKQLV